MEKIVLTEIESLLSPVDQAKLIGIIKKPKQLQKKEKNKYLIYCMVIACASIISYMIILNIIESNKKDKIN